MPSPVATSRSPRTSGRTRATVLAIAVVTLFALSGCLTQSQGKAHGLVNESRARAGIHALAHDSQAQAKAQAWAENLASRNQLAHSRLSDGMGSNWQAIAENVGWGSSIDHVHQQFMSSSSHRRNVLDRGMTHLGTGVARGNGKTYVVHVFVRR